MSGAFDPRELVVGCEAVLLDLDGTLVDSNYQHAFAWFRAFRSLGYIVPLWRVHRHIGMGGDQLVSAVASREAEDAAGDALREAQSKEFERLRDECEPLAGVDELIDVLKAQSLRVVLASSASQNDLDCFLERLDLRDRIDGWTTADDVERSKPHPDIVEAALQRARTRSAVMVGDSRWDVEAAAKAGIESLCVITGGWSSDELLEAGARAVFSSLDELARALSA
jgi:HAD superfamily hydrolase (TIGR01549 family)